MSKDVEVAKAGAGLGRPSAQKNTSQADPGRASDINALSFGGRAYTYDDDIPSAFRVGAKAQSDALVLRQKQKAGGGALVRARDVVPPMSTAALKKIEKQVIASGARQLDKPRKSLGRIVQRRIGWQATPTGIVITTAERELTRRADGKLAPSGDWLIEHRATHPNASGAAAKRVGMVPADYGTPKPAAGPSGATTGTSGGAQPESFPEGEFALSLLPSKVRSSVLGRVPVPTVFDGTVFQVSFGDSGRVSHQEVNVIRMDGRTAVVVQGKRKPDAAEWEVSQATYSLSEPKIEQV